MKDNVLLTRYVLFSAEGRINRREYWLRGILGIVGIWVFFMGVSFLLGIALYLAIMFTQSAEVADRVFDSPEFDTVLSLLTLPLGIALGVAHIWGLFSVLIKRLHDLDMRGWWSLLLFIPFFNLLLLVIVGLAPGNQEANRFGSTPKELRG